MRAVGRDELLQLRSPLAHVAAEAALNQADHHGRSDGSARGCTHQAGNGAVPRVDDRGTKLEGTEDRSLHRLNNLDALTSDNQLPVLWASVRDVLTQGLNTCVEVLQNLSNQVLGQPHLLDTNTHHGRQVGRTQRLNQVQVVTVLQELHVPAGVRTKEQTTLAVDNTSVQVRNRHRRRADGSLTVDLGVMLGNNFLVGAAQPLAGDWEATETTNLVNTSLLQQRQRVTAGTDEDEVGNQGANVLGVQVLHGDNPLGTVALQTGDLVSVANFSTHIGQCGQVLLGQCTEVNVRTIRVTNSGDRLGEVTPLGHQRQVLSETIRILNELLTVEQRLLLKCLVATTHERHLLRALSEGGVINWIDEFLRISQGAVFNQRGPQLTGNLELLINELSLGDIDLAVLLRRVVQLAQSRVAGTSVVPRGGRLLGGLIETLEQNL